MKTRHLFALVFGFFCLEEAAAQENIMEARESGVGAVVTVVGVVTSDENLGSVRYIQDETAGIAIYPGQDWSAWGGAPELGDSLSVTGEITEYNGLLEVGPDLTEVSNFGTGPVPEPLLITPSEMGENLEGQLVRISGVTFPLAGTFVTGNNTYDFNASGESGVIYVRTGNTLEGEELTGCEVDMIGIVSQFTFDGEGGYQLLPRGPGDLIATSDLCFTSPVTQSNMETTGFRLSWSTDVPCTCVAEYGPTPDLGFVEQTEPGSVVNHDADLEGLEPGSVYYARATCETEEGATATSTIKAYATVSESSGDIHVYFTGSVDTSVALDEEALSLGTSMNDTIASWIARADSTLDIAVYNFNNSALEAALNQAAANGIAIRYIYEGQNANSSLGALSDAIVTHPRTDEEGSGMHNKFIVGDADNPETAFVLTGSTNWTTAQLNTDLNNVIVMEDQSVARTYRIEFEEMWGSSGMTPDASNAKFGADKSDNTPHQFLVGGSSVEVYFSPSDGTNARILECIDDTNYELEFALLAFTRDDLSEAIQQVGSTPFINPVGAIEQINTTGSEYDALLDQGINVYSHQSVPHSLHHKYCIIDHDEPAADPVVITGSHNWSSTAENVNDENTVIVHDARVANLYHQEFMGIINAITGPADMLADQKKHLWNVMPNPAREQVWVQGLEATDEVTLLDASGRRVLAPAYRRGNAVQLDLGMLSVGMYHVAVTSDTGVVTTTRLAVQ